MLRCLPSPEEFSGNETDMTVLERLRSRLLWLQQQQQHLQHQQSFQQPQFQQNRLIENNFNELYQKPHFNCLNNNDSGHFLVTGSNKLGFSSPEITINSLEMDHSFSRSSNFPPAVTTPPVEEKVVSLGLSSKVTSTIGRDSFKKRKSEFGVAEECNDKKIKEDVEEVESKVTYTKSKKESSTTGTSNSKDNSKASEVQKQDFIHVRARRGQATDNHSLAERARREKISKKMRSLQDLVPGCNKITGKAGMLDEIINYVQSLQKQVEFLSMKLAAVNPRLDFNNGNLFAKEEFPAYAANFPTAAVSGQEMASLASLQFNAMQHEVPSCVLDMQMNPEQRAPQQRTPSSSLPDVYLETSSISQVQPFSAWHTDLQSLYNVEFN